MGDKGGRKDKDKSQKQEARKQKALASDKKAKLPKGKPDGKSGGKSGGKSEGGAKIRGL